MNIEKALILMSLICFVGCSTFNNSTVYMERNKGSEVINYKNDVAEVNLQFNPDVNFASMGVFGAPVIPLYFKIRKVRQIELSVGFFISQNKFFSFSTKPCLRINDGEELCPEHLSISAMGLRDIGSVESGGHTWVDICDFRDTKDINVDLTRVSKTDETDKSQILKHYHCSDEEIVEHLNVYYLYTYKCNGKCPQKIILNVKDIVHIDGLPIEDRNYVLERTLHNDYVMMWEQLQ